MQEIGKMIKSMVKVKKFSLMEISTKEVFKMEKERDMGHT